MPALTSFTRLLQVLPAGSPAYTHIYRLCSSGTSPQPQPQPQPASGGAAGSTSPTPRTSPASLDLGLNFAAMDFEAVARATQAAIARERGVAAPPLSSQREQERESKLDRQQSECSASRVATPPSPPPPTPSRSVNASFSYERPPSSSTAGRGFEVEQPAAAATARRSSGNNGAGQAANNSRYSLHDMLKDCIVERNGAKAFQLFSHAVDQACRQVLLPGRSSARAPATAILGGSATAGASGTQPLDAAREAECFAALRTMLAALPPTTVQDKPASTARRMNVKNLRGIARWNGQHYYLLWKCLLETGHLDEVRRVWSVMQQIGFTEYQMEEKTVNTLMALLRRTSHVAEHAATGIVSSSVVPYTERQEERLEQDKAVRRGLVKDLEQVAAARHFHLVSSNRRTAEGIRIAEALRRVDADAAQEEHGGNQDDDEGSPAEATGRTPRGERGSTKKEAAAGEHGEEESIIAVGDFNGLLRRSRTAEATERVLRMMAKLNLEMESSTFASLIASLHNPQYVLAGHTAEELSSHQTPATAQPSMSESDEAAAAAAVATAPEDAPERGDLVTKGPYEAYKQERVEMALQWFFQCPVPRRTADVYNELLYLLRSKGHWKDFDRALVDFRGNAVLTATEWPEVLPAATAAATTNSDTHTPSLAASVVLPPNWSTQPDGKTYELLIQRARYIHQWDVMWALYEEMRASRIRGTSRLYEVLLTEAHRHPPRSAQRNGSGGDREDASEYLLRLYEELRRNGGDVRSFKGTLNVVNAWSKTRAKATRWE